MMKKLYIPKFISIHHLYILYILETCLDGVNNQDELATDCGASGDCGACRE